MLDLVIGLLLAICCSQVPLRKSRGEDATDCGREKASERSQ